VTLPRWAALGAALVTWAGTGAAEPQTSVALTIGGGAGELRSPSPVAAFHMGLRGDLLLLRDRNGQGALGPYVEVLTRTFETFEAGGGLSVLVPLSDALPLILSAGPFVRGFLPRGSALGGWNGGVVGHAFIGSRSHNFHSVYGWQIGGFVDVRVGIGAPQQLDVLGGLQIDLEILGLPFLLLWNAFR
jgi:hypothetical protein